MKYLLLLFTLLFLLGADIAFGQSQNYLINGGFDLWQRGSANAKVDSNGYLADRWFATVGTYDRNTGNLPTGQKYGAQLALSSAGWLCQRIERDNIRHLSGQKMTISGYERSSSGTGGLKLKIDYANALDNYTGKGKNGSAYTNVSTTTLLTSTSTTLTQFRNTFSITSNMAAYGFQVCFGYDSNPSTTYQLSAIMLNEGMKKQSFRMAGILIGRELQLAQRYYEKSNLLEVDPGSSGCTLTEGRYVTTCGKETEGSETYVGCGFVNFKVNKRTTSSSDFHTYDCAGTIDKMSDANYGNPPINGKTQHTVEFVTYGTQTNTSNTGSEQYVPMIFNFTADAEL